MTVQLLQQLHIPLNWKRDRLQRMVEVSPSAIGCAGGGGFPSAIGCSGRALVQLLISAFK
ncbi:hypothetical protein QT995_17125 [Microcoleus sp. S36b_A3]|uniref:hypothetical protein n=1 Tax=unclassified Microcoleus TaxID=2642155 RepID=UPI002FCF093B